jgi:hypothetical protein
MPLPLSNLRTSSLRLNKANGVALALAGLACATFLAVGNPAAADDKAACEQFSWPVKRELAMFGAADLHTTASGATLDAPPTGVALQLQPNSAVAFVLPPERQPKSPESWAGVITIANVPKAGPYQVTTSAEAWIDVIQNGKTVASTAHTGKRDCADVRKSVRFELQPGAVTIQLSGADSKLIKLALLPVE